MYLLTKSWPMLVLWLIALKSPLPTQAFVPSSNKKGVPTLSSLPHVEETYRYSRRAGPVRSSPSHQICLFKGVMSSFSTTLSSSATDNIPMDTPARQSLPDHLRLEAIPGKGLGVITNVKIERGSVVGDYQGEVMTLEEKDRRYLDSCAHLREPADEEWRALRIERGQGLTGTYLYGIVVPGASHIFMDAEDEYCSLWTRFLNHSSDANVQPKSIHESWDGKPRVWFIALRDIEEGEEICFDYGDDYWLPEDNVV